MRASLFAQDLERPSGLLRIFRVELPKDFDVESKAAEVSSEQVEGKQKPKRKYSKKNGEPSVSKVKKLENNGNTKAIENIEKKLSNIIGILRKMSKQME